MTVLLLSVIVLALAFDFINGFHDAGNAIATIVYTKVLTPFQAVIWATFFNFVAYFVLTEHKIANTIAKIVTPDFVTLEVILCGLIAAIAWNLLTWWRGIPSSSSHTLIGGFMGAGLMNAALKQVNLLTAIHLPYILIIVSCIVLAPLLGLGIAYLIALLVTRLTKHMPAKAANHLFKVAQLGSSAALSFAHGGNDAQKVMGIIYIALVTANILQPEAAMPDWIALACYGAIALGTMSGGWRIIKTMGEKITKITPLKGVSAELSGAITLLVTEHFGIPVSTTHTVTGAIVGVGLTKGLSAVHWNIMHKLFWAWVITIPISALCAAVLFYLAAHIL